MCPDLWPLSPRFPERARELVRSKLHVPALGALRLVCRAARDDFVDGRAARVYRLRDDAPLEALARAAPRLRRVESIDWRRLDPDCQRGERRSLRAGDLSLLAEALERLPASGAASVRALPLGFLSLQLGAFIMEGPPAGPGDEGARRAIFSRLTRALTRLQGLHAFEVEVFGVWNDGLAELLCLVARLPALARLGVKFSCSWLRGTASPLSESHVVRAALPALWHLRALSVGGGRRMVAAWLAFLFLPEPPPLAAAAILTHLEEFEVDFGPDLTERSSGFRLLTGAAPAPWRAPWLARLRRLKVSGHADAVRLVSRALEPGSLPALRRLEVFVSDSRHATRADLGGLLRACNMEALETLSLRGAASAATCGAAAAARSALRDLSCEDVDWSPMIPPGERVASDDDDEGDDGGDGSEEEGSSDIPFEAIFPGVDLDPNRHTRVGVGALFAGVRAPLTKLRVSIAHMLPRGGAGLAPIYTRPDWRTSLRSLSLRLLEGPFQYPLGRRELRSLQGLSALAALEALAVEALYVEAAALEAAAAAGWAAGWAPRLRAFALRTIRPEWMAARHLVKLKPGQSHSDLLHERDALLALLRLPFGRHRLARLAVEVADPIEPADADAFVAACAAAYPAVSSVQVVGAHEAHSVQGLGPDSFLIDLF